MYIKASSGYNQGLVSLSPLPHSWWFHSLAPSLGVGGGGVGRPVEVELLVVGGQFWGPGVGARQRGRQLGALGVGKLARLGIGVRGVGGGGVGRGGAGGGVVVLGGVAAGAPRLYRLLLDAPCSGGGGGGVSWARLPRRPAQHRRLAAADGLFVRS